MFEQQNHRFVDLAQFRTLTWQHCDGLQGTHRQDPSLLPILEELGGAGTGVDYKAEFTRLRRSVALTFPPQTLAQGEEALACFRCEWATQIELEPAIEAEVAES